MNTDITSAQSSALLAFMYGVSAIDGLKPPEEVLIRAFSDDLIDEPVKPATYTQWLADLKGVEDLALQLGYFVGLCDGELTDNEIQYIESIGHALGIDSATLAAARLAAKSMLLEELSRQHVDAMVAGSTKR